MVASMTGNSMNHMLTKSVMVLLVTGAMVLSGAVASVAGEFEFRCKVTNEYELTDDGQLVKPKKYFYTGESFSIERSTGRISAYPFNNNGDYQMKVIDGGSFKVFSFAETRGVAESLAIRKYRKDEKQLEQYPFVGIDYLQTVVTGICD